MVQYGLWSGRLGQIKNSTHQQTGQAKQARRQSEKAVIITYLESHYPPEEELDTKVLVRWYETSSIRAFLEEAGVPVGPRRRLEDVLSLDLENGRVGQDQFIRALLTDNTQAAYHAVLTYCRSQSE
ncbi:TPA: hypothetical protein HA278_06040 [Candidatus Woesearchaeota archaeon]|nr:hypothetical protein [archaeon]HIJ11592.1 hypothetical protein [Candidatus Woesearchaeota archaeon]